MNSFYGELKPHKFKIIVDTIKNTGGQTLYVARAGDGPYKGMMISSLYGKFNYDLPISWHSRSAAVKELQKFSSFDLHHAEFGVEFNYEHEVSPD